MDYNFISAEELIASIELSLKLANAGIKINYEFSMDNRTLTKIKG